MVSLLASHIDLSRFEVRVFCVYGNPQNNVMERTVLEHGVPITYIRKGLGFSLKHMIRLGRELSSFEPDVVHTHLNACMYAAPWCVVHRVRMIHTIHSVPEKEAQGIRFKVMNRLYADGRAVPVAISERNRTLTASFYGLSTSQVEMIVNPVDLAAFRDFETKPWAKRQYDFIHVARFEKEKNHALLVVAFSRLVHSDREFANARMALVGEGTLRQDIEKLVHDVGIQDNVEFLGRRDDVAELMHDSKCFILPSDYEGLPMTILEAMAAGLPVVATKVGGVPDVVEDGITGLLVKAGDANALCDAMAQIVTDDTEKDLMSSAALKRVALYDSKNVAEGYEALYRKYSSVVK